MSEENELMGVWSHAEQVDAECTKEDTSGGYKATSINGYWFIKKATELWGPCGAGWGYDILEDRFDEAAIIKDESTDIPLCNSTMHTIKLQFWYTQNGERHTIVQYGHTPYIYQTKYGPKTDMEAPKKSLMDAIKKCLSMLGFASDVYLGEWDDPAYAALRHAEADIESADNKEEKLQEEIDKIAERATDNLKTMGESVKIPELDRIHKSVVRYLEGLKKSKSSGIKDEANKQLARVARGYKKRLGQLKEQQNETV
jgi:hypothetical protein